MVVATVSKYIVFELVVYCHRVRSVGGQDVVFEREKPSLQGISRGSIREWMIALNQFKCPLVQAGHMALRGERKHVDCGVNRWRHVVWMSGYESLIICREADWRWRSPRDVCWCFELLRGVEQGF